MEKGGEGDETVSPDGETFAPSVTGTPPFSMEHGERGQGGEGDCLKLTLLILIFLFTLTSPSYATEKPKAVLVLLSGVTIDDLKPDGKLPALRKLAELGSVGLLHNRVWGDFNENAAYLSVGASERMAAPLEVNSLKGLRDFQPNVANRPLKVGGLGNALHQKNVDVGGRGGIETWLVAGNSDGGSSFLPYQPQASLFVEKLPSKDVASGKINKYFQILVDRAAYTKRVIYIAVPFTPEIPDGEPYRHLGFLIAVGPGIKPGTLLTSPTTRTPGLVANVDIAPTITELYGTAIPGAAGQPVRAVSSRDVWGTLYSLDRQTNAAARATTPVLAGYGIFAGVSCLVALVSLRFASRTWQSAARFGLLVAASVLPALLVVGIIAPQTPLLYGLALAMIAIAIATVAHLVGARFTVSRLNLVFYVLVGTIVVDVFLHTHLVERSLLSASTLTGIRFYGIGNEWLGLLLGAAIACIAPWWLCILVVCAVGLPYFGADAGGTLAATTSFAVLFFAQRKAGLKQWHFGAAFAISLAVTSLFAVLDRLQPGSARSHVGAAVASGETRSGLNTLTELAFRKVAMNATLFLSPWTWITIIAMVAIGFGLRRIVSASISNTSELRSVIAPAAIAGALVAFLFNDGGVAAGLLIMVPILVRFLDALLAGKVESVNSDK